MNIGWILLIAAISIAALFVIFRPKRIKEDNIVVYGKPAVGTTKAATTPAPRVTPAKPIPTRSQAARARARDRMERNEGVDTSVTDALLLATVLDDGSTYETETYVEPERPYVPEPVYHAPTPTYTAPSHNDDGGRGGDYGGGGGDSGGGSDGGGGGGGGGD